MSAYSNRLLATRHFSELGLGAKLTSNAEYIIDSYNHGSIPQDDLATAAEFACGFIVDRVLWSTLGLRVGYLQNMQLLSDNPS